MTLTEDPFLAGVPVIEGFKTLGSCALYEKLGQGGMGAVYRARHINLDIDVAVKCLLPSQRERVSDTARREAVQRFVREARVAAQLGHENLVRVYDVAEAHELHYLVMEFVDGETLRGRVKRKGALAAEEAVTIILAAARGLAAAHRRGIIHRDIKPDNIMVSRQGEVKLADLGLARAAEAVDSLATSRGAIMGTPSYMPPEQFVDASQVGAPADVWSMGATLYFLLTGRDGIRASSPVEAMHQVCTVGFPTLDADALASSRELVAIIARCMAPEASERFADADELVSALAATQAAVEGATVLIDEQARPLGPESLVSPPPAPTLDLIREGMSGTTLGATPPPTPDDEVPTRPSAPGERVVAVPADSRRLRPSTWALFAVLGLAALVAAAGAAGLFETKAEPSPRAPVSEETSAGNDGEGRVLPSGPPDERFAQARELVTQAETLDEGISQLEALRQDAPQLEGLNAALAGALRAQAHRRHSANDWVNALRSCRASLRLEDSPSAREHEAKLVERIETQLRMSLTLQKPSRSKPSLELQMQLEGWISGNLVERVTLEGEPVEIFGGLFNLPWTAPAAGEHQVPLVVHGPEGVSSPARAPVRVDLDPPRIEIEKTAVQQGNLQIIGRVSDDTEVKMLRFDGEKGARITVKKDGRFVATRPHDTAASGEIRLWARDAAQRTTLQNVTLP
jgi:serine/threonine protein kinase